MVFFADPISTFSLPRQFLLSVKVTMIQRSFCDTSAARTALTLQRVTVYWSKRFYTRYFNKIPRFSTGRGICLLENGQQILLRFGVCFLNAWRRLTLIVHSSSIDGIDTLKIRASDDAVEEGNLLVEKLTALVKDKEKVVKILLTASLTKDQVSSSDDLAASMLSQKLASLSMIQDELTLVPHKLSEIYERCCKTISFAEIPMLYSPNTTIYTFKDKELQALVVAEGKGMDPLSLESYSPLEIRAWSIDHNGNHLARRYHHLRIRQFSGKRAIISLQFIPAGHLPDEMERRLYLIARGKRWCAYKDGVHHVGIMPGGAQV